MSAAETYDRVKAACCEETGLTPEELEAHIRAIAVLILNVKRQL